MEASVVVRTVVCVCVCFACFLSVCTQKMQVSNKIWALDCNALITGPLLSIEPDSIHIWYASGQLGNALKKSTGGLGGNLVSLMARLKISSFFILFEKLLSEIVHEEPISEDTMQ